MNAYDAAVTANLAAMGTERAEWAALPFEVTTDEDGRAVAAVDYSSASGYETAPTLYPSGVETCCGLCGHKIRNVYGLVNHARKWTLGVGSECVTHFGDGASGADLATETLATEARKMGEEIRRVFHAARVSGDFLGARAAKIAASYRTANAGGSAKLAAWFRRYAEEINGAKWYATRAARIDRAAATLAGRIERATVERASATDADRARNLASAVETWTGSINALRA